MFAKLGQYRKTVAAVVTGALGWGAVVVSSAPGPITSSEWIALGVVVATALGVYGVTNDPKS